MNKTFRFNGFAKGPLHHAGALACGAAVCARGSRIALVAGAFALVTALVLMMGFAAPAYAYVDPSVMTYTIQALAGVAVALSTVLGVAFRKTRKKLLRAMGVDENAGKIIDASWSRAGEEQPCVVASSKAKKGEKRGATGDDRGVNPSWKRRFALSLVVVAFVGFTLGIVAPFEMVSGSAGSLLFSLNDIWLLMTLFVAICVIVVSLLVSLIPGKAFTPVLVLAFCFGLCCYVQAMFMNSGLPLANGSTVDYWNEHRAMMIISAVVWIAILVLPQFFISKFRMKAQTLAVFFSVCLFVVQGVGVASLFLSSDSGKALDPNQGGPVYVTEDGLFEVSSKDNVIVFVLDRFDTKVMNQVLEENPDVMSDMPGFTYFDNHIGTMIPTMYAIPNLLTGEVPSVDESIEEYAAQRYARSSFLSDIEELGYSAGLYSDSMQLDLMDDAEVREYVADHSTNIHSLGQFNIDNKGTISALVKCALYRDMPWVLKWRFWFYTDEVNRKVASYSADDAPENTVYTMDDVRYFDRLNSFGLSVADDEGANGSFKFIHLNGAHDPYSLNEYGEFVGVGESTEVEQAKGSLFMVQHYVEELKSLGLYDNATIVITSDHGAWYSSLEAPTETINPLLMIKPAGSSEGFSVSNSPVSQADFQATIINAMGGDGSLYGGSYFDNYKADRTRDFYMITSDGGYVIDIFKYAVSGNALEMDAWEETGESWHVRDAS